MTGLEIESLHLEYPGRKQSVTALVDFSLAVPDGEIVVLLGESGCGKSSALNAVAGLVAPQGGRINLGGATLFERSDTARSVNAPPNNRDIGMVFQSYALWPHLSVAANVMYPLLRRGLTKSAARTVADEMLEVVRCSPLSRRYPGELSGGQQQRVALARALVSRPKLLLFDEPLSNLDVGLRRGLRDEIARLHRELKFTALYVTHDQSEALSLATNIAVMDEGRIVQHGSPTEVYEEPNSVFVANFFGANVMAATVLERCGTEGKVSTPLGILQSSRVVVDGAACVSVLPERIQVSVDPAGIAKVVNVMYLGQSLEIKFVAGETDFVAVMQYSAGVPRVGDRVSVSAAPDAVHVHPSR